MSSGSGERRAVRRMVLDEPLIGSVGHAPVMILDVSPAALRISHHGDLGAIGSTCVLRFVWRGRSLSLLCRIVRSETQQVGRAAYAQTLRHTALEIVNAIADAGDVLTAIIRSGG